MVSTFTCALVDYLNRKECRGGWVKLWKYDPPSPTLSNSSHTDGKSACAQVSLLNSILFIHFQDNSYAHSIQCLYSLPCSQSTLVINRLQCIARVQILNRQRFSGTSRIELPINEVNESVQQAGSAAQTSDDSIFAAVYSSNVLISQLLLHGDIILSITKNTPEWAREVSDLGESETSCVFPKL